MMKLRKKKLEAHGLNFEFSRGLNSVQINFSSELLPRPHSNFDRDVKESGMFRISLPPDEKEKIEFLIAPYLDIVTIPDDDKYYRELKKLKKLGVNCLQIKAEPENTRHEFNLLIEPSDITEEGWYFEFSEATFSVLAGYTETISAKSIIDQILVSDTLVITLISRLENVSEELLTFRFPYLDEFRDFFAAVFGRAVLENIITGQGYEIHHD